MTVDLFFGLEEHTSGHNYELLTALPKLVRRDIIKSYVLFE